MNKKVVFIQILHSGEVLFYRTDKIERMYIPSNASAFRLAVALNEVNIQYTLFDSVPTYRVIQ